MSKPANPIEGRTWERRFEHAPGALPFYALLASDGVILMSAIVFADDEAGARALLREACGYSARELARTAAEEGDQHEHTRDAAAYVLWKRDILRQCLDTGEPVQRGPRIPQDGGPVRLSTYRLTVQQFDRTHFLKVAWASNDTF